MTIGDAQAIEIKISEQLVRLHAQLRVALTLAADEAARNGALGDETAAAFELSGGAGWALIDKRSFRIERSNMSDWPTRSYPQILQTEAVAKALRTGSAWRKADRSAENAVKGLLGNDRAAMRQLLAMAPLVEAIVYALAMNVAEYLDAIRPSVRRDAGRAQRESELARRYWHYVAMFGRATLVATTTGARAWLAGAAQSFTWERWTPSFTLMRERNPWLCAIAARAAAEAGPDVLPLYADALRRARHPLFAADAIFGLTAIGLREETVRSRALSMIEDQRPLHEKANLVAPELFELLGEQAERILRHAGGAAPASARPFTPSSFRIDPMTLGDGGTYPLLADLWPALTMPLRSLISAVGTGDFIPGRKRALPMFERAWGSELKTEANKGSKNFLYQ